MMGQLCLHAELILEQGVPILAQVIYFGRDWFPGVHLGLGLSLL